ncbi:MAG: hypothetical protein JSW34_04210 [Candidatus Zixiibacteriota bacterium]|nr:MAG: hypothetical protein JSW34_04210 [candidate division Zixibacteria bacterium]
MPDYARGSITGFKKAAPSPLGCGLTDNLDMMWSADNDGDPVDGEFVDEVVWTCELGWIKSATSVHGIYFLDYPGAGDPWRTRLSFNWWSGFFYFREYDFGPRRRDNYRDFGTGGSGWPWKDPNRYYVMSNGEIDYDVLYSASIGFDDPVWLPPPAEIAQMASVRGLPAPPNLLSVGPFDIAPGASVRVPFAFVGGENFHTDPANIQNLPHSPDRFYDNLDFSDLIQHAAWARWVYDNPGVDTDGDEYAGDFVECNGDTVYYTGDGIPDWRGALPPPAPQFRLEPMVNGLRVRFNGMRSETSKDVFSDRADFEGYRIYCGLDQRAASLRLLASYDREDYDKHVWNGRPGLLDSLIFYIVDPPFSPDSLRCLYGSGADPCGDATFDPLDYTPSNPYIMSGFSDSAFYFLPHDYNVSEWGVTTPIRKVYPDEPYPVSLHPDSVPVDALTDDGYFKYFEYEFTIESLLPTVPYWVNVTAFDAGVPSLRLKGLETSVTLGAKSAYPLGPSDSVGGVGKVCVYPNPYRIDGDYRDLGLEGRLEEDRPDYRVRAVHFRNLPAKCTIYIYSLDGDLVRRLEHDMDPSDPNSSHDTWNLITRNTQMVVSGLYYWVVEAEDGSTQMGKLVIIM